MDERRVSGVPVLQVISPAARAEMDRQQAAKIISVLLFVVLYVWGIASGLAALSQDGTERVTTSSD